jgi:hypothetical protein
VIPATGSKKKNVKMNGRRTFKSVTTPPGLVIANKSYGALQKRRDCPNFALAGMGSQAISRRRVNGALSRV